MNILETLGKIAGIGGISLAVFLLLFKDVIRKNVFPQLQDHQAFKIIRLFLFLTFSVAALGVFSYVYITVRTDTRRGEDPQALTLAEQQSIDLEKQIVTLVGRWDNADNSPKDKREVIEIAPALASRMESLKDDQLRPAWRIVKAEYSAYALVMAASTVSAESELNRQTKKAYAEKAYATAIQGLDLVRTIEQSSSSDPVSANGSEFAARDRAVDRLKVLAAMSLCRQHDLVPMKSILLEAQKLIDSISPAFLADYPVSRNSELNCVRDPEVKRGSVK